jgi:glucokinase
MTVGIDLTETPGRAVAVDDHGVVTSRAELPLAADRAAVAHGLRKALKPAPSATARVGVVTLHPNDVLPTDVADALGGHPLAIDAGAACVVAESWCGAASGAASAAVVTLRRHVAAGALLDGRVLRGAHGFAISVAWLAVNPVERDDYRRYGGLEAEVSAAGIVRRFVWRIKAGDHSAIESQVGGDLTRVTVDQILNAARVGDGVSVSVVRDTIRYVGLAVSNLATILDPECIVLGGTLASAADLMLDPVRQECHRRLLPAHAERLQIVPSTLGADAAAIGAARAAHLSAS